MNDKLSLNCSGTERQGRGGWGVNGGGGGGGQCKDGEGAYGKGGGIYL